MRPLAMRCAPCACWNCVSQGGLPLHKKHSGYMGITNLTTGIQEAFWLSSTLSVTSHLDCNTAHSRKRAVVGSSYCER